jgi:hypothetical protein
MKPLTSTPTPDAAIPTPALSAERTRELLRKLRDLNLCTGNLEVSGNPRVRVNGCLSLDSPVEHSLRYLIHQQGDVDQVLEIIGREGALELDLRPRVPEGRSRSLHLPLLADAEGRAVIPDLEARVDPESSEYREIEHFLRRLVTAACAQS